MVRASLCLFLMDLRPQMLENLGGNSHLVWNKASWVSNFLCNKLENCISKIEKGCMPSDPKLHSWKSHNLGHFIYGFNLKKCTEIRVRSRVARSPMAVEYLNNTYVAFFDNQGYDLAFFFWRLV